MSEADNTTPNGDPPHAEGEAAVDSQVEQTEPVESKAYVNPEEGRMAEKAALETQHALNLQSMPIRQYLDQTVVPILLPALNEVALRKPNDPVEFLAYYLLQNNPHKKNTTQ
eukprot:GHVR01084781.1.p1 GENE.GHVR01084781.1~~GHVR01084781.1.p1  ORF type:complete len:112 (+),score=33.81 GHVR01084781.1:23-358(+)